MIGPSPTAASPALGATSSQPGVTFDHAAARCATQSEAEVAYARACNIDGTWRVCLDTWQGRWVPVATFARKKVCA